MQPLIRADLITVTCFLQRIRKILLLLQTMEQWSDEIELLPETQRFGNRAFRKYITLVEEVSWHYFLSFSYTLKA